MTKTEENNLVIMCMNGTATMAVPREWTTITRILAESLHCYATEDDVLLDRTSFLEIVVSRIKDDLKFNQQ